MEGDKRFKRIFAIVIVGVLSVFLFNALLPFISAFFGAVILFTLFYPIYKRMVHKLKMKKNVAALLIILLTFIIVLVPLGVLIKVATDEVSAIISQKDALIGYIDFLDESLPQIDMQQMIEGQLSGLGSFLQQAFVSTLLQVGNVVIQLIIMYFVLYYLLVDAEKLPEIARAVIPFNKKNAERLIDECRNVTFATIGSSGLIAILQGIMLAAGFIFFGIDGAVFWGFITIILSFLPVVGAPIIWIPAGVYLLIQQNWFGGFGILIWGTILSNVDNLIRPALQLRMGKMHPLVSVVGVFIGLAYFGLVGIFIGPLLISYFILTVQMFREEYMRENSSRNKFCI